LILEGADAEREESHLIQRDGRHLAELRAGRVQARTGRLLPVEDILRRTTVANAPPSPKRRWIERFVNVSGMPRTPSMRNKKTRAATPGNLCSNPVNFVVRMT